MSGFLPRIAKVVEQSRVNQKLFLIANRPDDLSAKLGKRHFAYGPMQVYGGMIGLQQRQAAQVAEENMAAWSDNPGGFGEHLQQVIQRWEVLRDRVQNDEIDAVIGEKAQLMRLSLL